MSAQYCLLAVALSVCISLDVSILFSCTRILNASWERRSCSGSLGDWTSTNGRKFCIFNVPEGLNGSVNLKKKGSTPLPFLLGLPPSCFNVGLVPCQLIGEMNKQDFPAAGKWEIISTLSLLEIWNGTKGTKQLLLNFILLFCGFGDFFWKVTEDV